MLKKNCYLKLKYAKEVYDLIIQGVSVMEKYNYEGEKFLAKFKKIF